MEIGQLLTPPFLGLGYLNVSSAQILYCPQLLIWTRNVLVSEVGKHTWKESSEFCISYLKCAKIKRKPVRLNTELGISVLGSSLSAALRALTGVL